MDYLARAAEQLGWDDTPAGQQKRLEDLALLQELMAVTKVAILQTGDVNADSPCNRYPKG
jgi:hypothetical protein